MQSLQQHTQLIRPPSQIRTIDLLTEKRRRRREERMWEFEPTAPPDNDQTAFMASTAKIRAVFGGNRSGKTEVGVADCLQFCQGVHAVRSLVRQPPVYVRYLAPSWEDGIKAVIIKKFQQLVPREWLIGGEWAKAWSEKARTLSFANGSLIRFFTYEQDVNKMGGDDIDAFYADEHMPEKMFIETMMRTVDRDGYGVMTLTPESGITWEFDKIVEAADDGDTNVAYWTFTTYGNPYLSKEGIAQVESMITDDRLRDAKLLGKFVSLSGLVYPQWDRKIHILPELDIVPDNWFLQFIIDPHHRKPSFMIWMAWNPDGQIAHVIKEAEFAPSEGGVKTLANFIRNQCSEVIGPKVQQWIGDEAMGGDGLNIYGDRSVLEQLRRLGLPVMGTNQEGSKAFAAGVNRVRELLTLDPESGHPRLYVHAGCVKTIKQIERYQYRRETKLDEETLREHVRNVEDEGPTCIRYGAMAEPQGMRRRTTGPVIVLPHGRQPNRVTGRV